MTKRELTSAIAMQLQEIEACTASGASAAKARERLKNTLYSSAGMILDILKGKGGKNEPTDREVELENKVNELEGINETLDDALADADLRYKNLKHLMEENGVDVDGIIAKAREAEDEAEAGVMPGDNVF